jgi:four helix bundle protein
MDEKMQDLHFRTKEFALQIIRLCASLPKSTEAQALGAQILRCGASIGACCETRRAKSDAELISKMESALQELDETVYWLELLAESGIIAPEKLEALRKETDELNATFVATVTKIKNRLNSKRMKAKSMTDEFRIGFSTCIL